MIHDCTLITDIKIFMNISFFLAECSWDSRHLWEWVQQAIGALLCWVSVADCWPGGTPRPKGYGKVYRNKRWSIFIVHIIICLDETFLVLYKELRFRHIYAKHKVHVHKCMRRLLRLNFIMCTQCIWVRLYNIIICVCLLQPTIEQRFESYQNYVELFNLIIGI